MFRKIELPESALAVNQPILKPGTLEKAIENVIKILKEEIDRKLNRFLLD